MNSKDDDTKTLFRCIITLNHFRILSRLQSKHAKKIFRSKNKSVLFTLLNTALHDQFVQLSSNISNLKLKIVRTQINALKALFKRFENISEHCAAFLEVQNVIMNLITFMHNLTLQMKLKSVLEFFSRLDFELKSFLSEAVEKLDRYYSINYELICVARSKKYFIFHNVAIKTSSIRRFSQSSNVNENLHSLTALQQILRSRTAVQAKTFKFSLKKCLRKSLQVILDDFRLIIANYY